MDLRYLCVACITKVFNTGARPQYGLTPICPRKNCACGTWADYVVDVDQLTLEQRREAGVTKPDDPLLYPINEPSSASTIREEDVLNESSAAHRGKRAGRFAP